MIQTFAMLGKMYEKQIVTGWYASEKLDGCRALWIPDLDPQYSNDPGVTPTGLWTRDGKVIHAPKWWLSHLPKFPVDGELWLDRQQFQRTMSVVRKKSPIVKEWQYIKFMAFDIPIKMNAGLIRFRNNEIAIPDLYLHPGIREQKGFRFVYHILETQTTQNDIFKVIKQTPIRNKEHLQSMLDDVVNNGGEGLMLREPYSKWEQCRSNFLLKVKPIQTMEVRVCGYFYGDGKYYGMMGALEVEDSTGKRFKVSGFTDQERRVPSCGLPFSYSREDDCVFKKGDTITIKYRELTKGGIPKEARYHRGGIKI